MPLVLGSQSRLQDKLYMLTLEKPRMKIVIISLTKTPFKYQGCMIGDPV